MKIFKPIFITLLIIAAVGGLIWRNSFSDAATGNPGPTLTGYQQIVVPISAITTTRAAIVSFKAPWPFRVLGFSAVQPVNFSANPVTLDLTNSAGTSLLSSAMTLSTVVTEATLTTTSATLNITDETAVSINTAGTGTAGNVTVQMVIKRL